MSVDVVTETIIKRPRAEVAAFAASPDNAPRWYANIKSVEWKSEPPLRLGSRIAFVAEFLGRRLMYTYEVVEFVLDERLVMRTTEGPFAMETTYEWAEGGGVGTRMTLRNRGTPSGFSRLAAPLLAANMRKANRKDLERLKSLLEAPADAPAH
ncbi:MAG TPA: SRPBCC family protein [Thermoleophilia bacterium]